MNGQSSQSSKKIIYQLPIFSPEADLSIYPQQIHF